MTSKRAESVTSIDILLHEELIGSLALFPGDRTLFVFHDEYIENPDRPTLSLSFKDTLGELITDVRSTRIRIPPFFSNLLPEGSLRDYLAKKANVNPLREFYLLEVLGRDLPGAVTVSTERHRKSSLQNDLISLNEPCEGQGILHFSLAGVQLKFSAIMETTGGLTIPAEGTGGSWIVKLPSLIFPAVPENEFAMMTLARRIGMNIPEVRLIPLNDITGLPREMEAMKGNALAVKRFDRGEDGKAIHIEDFAQIFGLYPEKKYEKANYRNIAQVIQNETDEVDVEEFIRRLVFNTLIGNADMHLKNWSLIYPDKKKARLAPGYDFISTIAYLPDTEMALNFSRSKKMTELSQERLSWFTAKAKLPERRVMSTASNTAESFMDIWKNGEAVRDIAPQVIAPINRLLPQIPIVKNRRV